ncbi:transcriptional regulator [Azotobacter vinelandii]|uniref:4-hydroxyphenylacetate catabolism regulatory protein HpaA n=1 Tax=Azotobacter TaxID=352 RepID=UPI0007740691|nr:4-hydroxyphenylacetate catabolism regulatory protein HpaA [Azotobacter vinelandii]GLK59502.1 transcriptional regulator [Azotobacter vinelandii]SFY13761.1 AraC family transcriptional regulator, 4-hydroxyphenylacetate 3-monooxygenase operon regulatory protein [Azotobacter vinelandii]
MREKKPIPNINIGQIYDQRYAEAEVHYESLDRLAEFFGRNMPVHRHDRFFQVHYVKNGMVRLYLDDRLYQHHGPMFFLTPPTVPHAFSTSVESTGHVLTVRQDLVWPLLEPEWGLAEGMQINPVCLAIDELRSNCSTEVSRLTLLFDSLCSEFASDQAGRELSISALTHLIFISLLRLSSRSLKTQPIHRGELLIFQRFNVLIEEHYRDHWSLTRYAEVLGVTEARLNSVCRQIVELSSKRLIFDRLTQEAKRLLLFTGDSVNEIGYRLGFKDPAYFCRFFLRHAGTTPGEYRAQQRNKNA